MSNSSENDTSRIDTMTDKNIDTSDILPLDEDFSAKAELRMSAPQESTDTEDNETEFYVHQWEIWHTYSTYFNEHITDLEKAAKLFVDLEIAECSLLSNGKTFCKTNKGVLSGETLLDVSADRRQVSAKFSTDFSEEFQLTPYAHETWLIGVQFLFGEARIISDGLELPTLHLRAFLKPIDLVKKEERITGLYPVITLYQSGIILIEFRAIAPDESIEINDFIRKYVNIQACDYDYAMVPTAISILAPEAYQLYLNNRLSVLQRFDFLKKKKRQKSLFLSLARRVEFGDFEFEMSPLLGEGKESITSLAQTLFTIVGFIAESPLSSAKFILKGSPNLPEIGNYWFGRPHVHLIEYDNQQVKSSDNEAVNGSYFGQILARVPNRYDDFRIYLPPDSRTFEDYSAYITSASTLWAWSKSGLEKQQQWMDLNRGHLIYEHQVQAELLEYGFMLHKSLAEKAKTLTRYLDVLVIRRDLVELKTKMLETTPYGEVRNLLSKGWEQMGLEEIQNQISENLSILDSEIKFIEAKQTDSFRTFLAILSLVASASLAKSIVKPLWDAFGFWLPSNTHWADLFLVGISSMIVVMLILLLRNSIYRQ